MEVLQQYGTVYWIDAHKSLRCLSGPPLASRLADRFARHLVPPAIMISNASVHALSSNLWVFTLDTFCLESSMQQ
jgi:hypothetical protein